MVKYEVIYLAGALRGNPIKKFFNMRKAKSMAKKLWTNGICAIYSPHMNSGWLDSPMTDRKVMEGNLEILRRCNVIAVMQGYENSKGTIAEIEFAKKNNIRVVYL